MGPCFSKLFYFDNSVRSIEHSKELFFAFDEISGSRSYGLSLFMSGKQSLSLSLDEESSVEAVEDILFINLKTSSCRLYFFARKQRHRILEPSLFVLSGHVKNTQNLTIFEVEKSRLMLRIISWEDNFRNK